MEKLLVKVGTLLAIVITLTIGSCNIHKNHKIAKMAESGINPVTARLALEDGSDGINRLVYLINNHKCDPEE